MRQWYSAFTRAAHPETVHAQETAAAADEKLVRLMQQDAVIRKVALTYILQRVTVGDLTSAEPLLLAAKEARSQARCSYTCAAADVSVFVSPGHD